MSLETISIGLVPNDQSGDNLRAAGQKINGNFAQLLDSIVTEISNRILAINSEATVRSNADIALESAYIAAIAIETANRNAAIAVETDARIVADTDLQAQIITEISNRITADNTEITLRTNADTSLQSQISAEIFARIAADNALQVQIDALSDALKFRGAIDCSTNPNYPAADTGDVYKISVAGKIGGVSGPNVEVNDSIICMIDDTPSGPEVAVGANWVIIQGNVDGVVIGPPTAIIGDPAVFDGPSGKLLKVGTITSLLDKISSTHGAILFRGSANWQALNPGESGHVLSSGGNDADPLWRASASKYVLGATWQNQGSVIIASDANVVYVNVPTSGTIAKWEILTSDGTGSCQIDIWKSTYLNYPPTVSDSITASSKPNIPNGIKASDTVLDGWSPNVTAGEVLAFKLESSTTFKFIYFFLEIIPS